MLEQEQILSSERKGFKPIDTRGVSPASLFDTGILAIAYNLVSGNIETRKAAWERRLAEKVSRWSQMKNPTRNVEMLLKNIAPIIEADSTILSLLKKEEYLVFAMTIRAIQKKRAKSAAYYSRKCGTFLTDVPFGTRLARKDDVSEISRDWVVNNPPILTRVLRFAKEHKVKFGLLGAGVSGLGLVAWNNPGDSQAFEPLFKDQTKTAPSPDFAKTSPPEVAKVHKVVQDIIASLPPESAKPEILYRLVDGEGNYIKGAKVRFDGVEVETNGAGLIYITGENSLAFNQLTEKELKIELPNGKKIIKRIEVHGGLNSHVLNRNEEFIVATQS